MADPRGSRSCEFQVASFAWVAMAPASHQLRKSISSGVIDAPFQLETWNSKRETLK
jgi:hypothetical protein